MTTPIFQKSYDFYKHFYRNLRQIPKRDRFTWGERAENTALKLLSLSLKASYSPKKQKRSLLKQMSNTLDLLKIYIRLGHDLKILDDKKYIARQSELQEIGKMLGGWIKTV